MLSFRMLSRIGVGGCCKVAYKYPGSFAPSRWFPPALKQRIEYGPYGLTHASPRVSPMRTASGYQAPAVPYHTPIVTDFSTPNLILLSGTRNILPTKGQRTFLQHHTSDTQLVKIHSVRKILVFSISPQNFTFSLRYSAPLR